MIRAKTSDTVVLTTPGADALKMEIDMDGLVHICDMLIGQYSDEEMAVLREYSTNARDSHIAAHQERIADAEQMLALVSKRGGDALAAQAELDAAKAAVIPPIEVTLPIGPYDMPTETRRRSLRIKDYGVGLSIDELATVFSRIGKSTKDQTNDQQGMMGIGGKSGLCATFGSFTITAIKDGEKAVVSVGRNEATEPVMYLVSQTPTDEPNGVEIELPAPKYHKLARKAHALFQFWPEGSVLVDGVAPERLKPKVELAPHMWICDDLSSKGVRSDFIVMGDVPYPVQLDAKLDDKHSLVIFVPIGAVTIAPSREALRMTPETKEELARLMAEYDQLVKTVVQRRIGEAKSMAEALRLAVTWRGVFHKDADLGIEWRGRKIPVLFDLPPSRDHEGAIAITEREHYRPAKISRQDRIYVGTLLDAVLVEGYDPTKKFTAIHKKKLNAWARLNNKTPKHYVLTAERLAPGWIPSSQRVCWEDIRKFKVHVPGHDGRARIKGSYDMWINKAFNYGKPANEIPVGPIFHMEKDYFVTKARTSRFEKDRLNDLRIELFRRYPTATFVELTPNRVAKFCRDFPEARHIQVALDEIYNEFVATATKAKLARLAIEESAARNLIKIDPNKVDDPKVKTAIKQAKRPVDTDFRNKMRDMLRITGRMHRVNPELNPKWKNPLDRYPLFNSGNLNHSYIYMNAVYAQENKR